jgi:hypothetical protein
MGAGRHSMKDEVSPFGDSRLAVLTADERAALEACEAIVSEGIGVWMNVSNALAEISARRLYRETHTTFESYIRERFGVSRSQGHRLVLAGRVAASSVGEQIKHESQAREIARLLDQPELLASVVARAHELSKTLTARALRQARLELTVGPEEAKVARRVWNAAEYSRERHEEWLTRAETVANLYCNLPVSFWHRVPNMKVGKDAIPDLRWLGGILAFDAVLSPAVCWFLRNCGYSVTGLMGPVNEGMSTIVEVFNRIVPDGERERFLAAPTVVIQRIAEVVEAVDEVAYSAGPEAGYINYHWSDEEIAAIEARWDEFTASLSYSTWAPGPMLEGIGEYARAISRRFAAEAGRRREIGEP